MKKTFQSGVVVFLALLLLFSFSPMSASASYTDLCECPNPNLRDAGSTFTCFLYQGVPPVIHTWTEVVTQVCLNCQCIYGTYKIPRENVLLNALPDKIRRLNNSSTQHWYSETTIWDCPKCYVDEATTFNETKYPHNTSQGWHDGGHSGLYHSFYHACDVCGYHYETVSELCPGGENHIVILALPLVPTPILE